MRKSLTGHFLISNSEKNNLKSIRGKTFYTSTSESSAILNGYFLPFSGFNFCSNYPRRK